MTETSVTTRPLVPRIPVAGAATTMGVAVPLQPPVPMRRRHFTSALPTLFAGFNLRQAAGGGSLLPLFLLAWFALVTQLDAQAFTLLLPEIQNDFGLSVG